MKGCITAPILPPQGTGIVWCIVSFGDIPPDVGCRFDPGMDIFDLLMNYLYGFA